MKKMSAFRITVLSLFVVFLVLPHPAHADIAPPPAPHGSDISPETENTYVRMVSETVRIEVLPNAAGQTAEADVSALFTMRNLGEKEESMTVRFPLNLTLGVCEMPSFYRPLQNFEVWLDAQPVPITIERQVTAMGYPWEGESDCWANFPVTFPIGIDVQIRVHYIQEASPNNRTIDGFDTFPYTIYTGAGWYGTIGSGDIVFHAPWPLDDETLIEYRGPGEGAVIGNEIRWHFKDFEPEDYFDDVSVTIVDPAVWSELNRARRDLVADPKDGEAWGHLGKALKLMTLMRRGVYREDYYYESYFAYQKAIDLKPWDADWHYGFAELICQQVSLYTIQGDPPTDNFERDCYTQLKAALQINPRHEKAIQYLMYWDLGCADCVKKYGLDIYLNPALTEVYATQTQLSMYVRTTVAPYLDLEMPTETPTPSPLHTKVTSAPQIMDTPLAVASESPTPLISPKSIAQLTTPVTPTALQENPTGSPVQGAPPCGLILLPVIISAFYFMKQVKR